MRVIVFVRALFRQFGVGLRLLLSLLFPSLCLGCGAEGEQLCECCFSEVISGGVEKGFYADLLKVSTFVAAARYRAVARLCVLSAKHDGQADPQKWTEVVGQYLAERLWESIDCRGALYVVPAPSGLARRWSGRYVAAELSHEVAKSLVEIARQLGESCRVEVVCALQLSALRGSQAGRSAAQRNLRSGQISAFDGVLPHSARVVLIDDVVASGGTLKGCVNALRGAGAAVVAVAVACASTQAATVG
ncbi:ComF family protein [Boudabousia marimammalium]|uniref:Phosphoribosyltransferase domain-containing protein n=1 Tax=Boudabousia marimammalium TaxID=156892 RepID=A0A1Q5PRF8_9ACTO|nr:phosphoribosyltransferase family protein [Boudabousia marimammalium]OKL50198.1 hypothetical protein BM477_02050 [Boudabousia marimammalium]